MSTPENRVRIVIETDNASGRRGIQETVTDLDALAAKGKAVDLSGVLKLDASAVTQPVAKATQAVDGLGATVKKAGEDAGAAMAGVGKEVKKVGDEADAGGKTGRAAMRNLGTGAAEAKAQAEALGANLSDIRTLAAQLAPVLVAAFGVDQVMAFANQVVGAAMAMEQLAATYKAVFKDNAAEQLRYAAGMADAFGKSLLDVAGAYKKFAAASEAVGLSTDNQRRTFEAVTAAITKVGGSSQDVSGALLALEQMLSKGTVQAEEYRQQFAERIPGALKMGADALGVTTAAFQKMMENGEVISNDFIPKLTAQLEKFGDGWQATADTTAANVARLQNSFLELSNSPALTGLVNSVVKVGTAFNKNLNHNLEQFRVMYLAIMAEAKGDLSPFATWTNDLDGLKKQLDALDQRKTTYVKDLKDQAQGLAEALVKVQTHQVDFGPSGETVDQLRAKLKWFQDQITALTGQTWVVNVVAQMDNSQLVQAKAYIQDLIKGTAEYKSRSLEAKQYSLDNAVNIVTTNKTAVEAKLANPNLDLREADALSRELENLNGQLADASLGYKELGKQREELARQQIKDSGAVAGFNAGRGGVNESELDKGTRVSDAHALSIARQTDAYAELRAGLTDLPGYYEKVRRIQEAEDNTVKNLTKSSNAAANAMERFESQGAAYLQSIENQIDALSAQLGGDSLAADLAKVDKRYDQLAATIRKAMIGAKGDVADYQTALAKLEEARGLEQQIVQIKAWGKAMDTAAATIKDLGRLTGDPDLIFGGAAVELQKWAQDQEKTIKSVYANAAERAQALADLKEEIRLKELENQKSAFAELSGVSDNYWKAAWALLDEHLKRVKDNCDSEVAYEAYAAKKRSELRKQEIEARLEYETDFLSTLKDALSLEFGLYKDAGTRRRDAWVSLSKEIASGVHDLSDAVAGGATDAFKAWITGSGSMADAFKSAMDSMLDYLMTIIKRMIAYALENYVIIPIVESVVGTDSGSLTGSASGSGTNSLSSSALSKITSKATDYGISKGLSYVGDLFSSGGTSLASLSAASATEMGALASTGAGAATTAAMTGTTAGGLGGYTAVTSGAASGGALAGASSAGIGLGTALSVVGGVAALGGLLAMGFSQTKTEEKTGSGIRVAIIGDSTNVSGTDYYKVTSSSMLGGSSTSHEIRSTGPADSETTSAVNDALGTYTTAIKSGFKELGVETADSLKNFYFPEWDVAPGQEEDYYRNVSNAKVGKILADSGLTDAFSAIAKEGEPWVDQLARLTGSLSTVKNATAQMGLSLESLAGEDYISGLVNKMLAAGDSAGTAGMDFSSLVGVLDDETLKSLQDMQAQASATGQEVQATNEQLRQLALAQYASDLVDVFGSADAVSAAFSRLLTNAYTVTEQANKAVGYYAQGANQAIAALGDATLTADNFWASYRSAMETSAISPEQLKAWDDAAQWVEKLDAARRSTDALAQSARDFAADLTYRTQVAQGRRFDAEITRLLADQEKELAQARTNGASAAQLAGLQETQRIEEAAKRAAIEAARQSKLEDALSRYYTAIGDDTALLNLKLTQNERELADIVWDYGYEVVDALRRAMVAETIKEIADAAAELAATQTALRADLTAREQALAGLDDQAEATRKLAAYALEFTNAVEGGASEADLARLAAVQSGEMSDYWTDAINRIKESLGQMVDTIEARISAATEAIQDYTDGQLTGARAAYDLARDAADKYTAAFKSVRSALTDLRYGDTSPLGVDDKYRQARGDWQSNYAKAMTGDVEAQAAAGDLAKTYAEAAQSYFATAGEYQIWYAEMTRQLAEVGVVAGGQATAAEYQAQLLEKQISLLELLNNELASDDPNTELLQQTVAAIGVLGDLLGGTLNTAILDDATAPALYSAVNSLTGQTVRIGDLSLDQLGGMLDYSKATVDETGKVKDATLQGNLFLETQEGLLLSGNATQDILRQFSAQNISVSQAIKDAILGDSNVANGYLLNVQSATTQMVSLLGEFLEVTQQQRAEQERLLHQAEIAAAQSQAQTIYNQTLATLQSTDVGQLTSQLATTGAGWQAISGLPATQFEWTHGLSVIDALRAGYQSTTNFVGWYLQNYGTGTGAVDWDAAMSSLQGMGLLPANVSAMLAQYQAAMQQVANLRAAYGFADGGVMTSAGPLPLTYYSSGGIAESPQVAIYGEGRLPEAFVPLPDGRSIPVTLSYGSRDEDDRSAPEVRALRTDFNKFADKVERALWQISSNTGVTALVHRGWDEFGLPGSRETAEETAS